MPKFRLELIDVLTEAQSTAPFPAVRIYSKFVQYSVDGEIQWAIPVSKIDLVNLSPKGETRLWVGEGYHPVTAPVARALSVLGGGPALEWDEEAQS